MKKSPQELLAQALQFLSVGQLREAQRACRKVLQARPDLPEGHLLLSEIHHQGGDAPKARESASRALKLRPGWSEAYVALGNAEALAGNLKAAEEQFIRAIAAGSPGAGVHANLGHVLRQQGRLEEARGAYQRAQAHAPDALELQLNMALIESELGNKARALDIAQTAAMRFPAAPQAHFALGNALADDGRHEQALAPYQRTLELDPGFSAARINHAAALFAGGRNREATRTLRDMLQRDPSASEPRAQLLRVLYGSREFQEMERVARDGMALHPGAAIYVHQLGLALWWQQRREEALAALEMVDRVSKMQDAAYQAAKLDQAACLLALGRLREGWEAYRHRPSRRAARAAVPKLIDDPNAVAALALPRHILVLGEQGLGDDIFFLRFAPALRSRGHRLSGCFVPRVSAVVRGLAGLFDGLTEIYDPAAIDADLTVLSSDLPLASAQDQAPPFPLPVESARRERFAAQLRQFGPPPYVGVTWRAGLLPDERQADALALRKEVPPAELGAALRPLKASVVSLQRKPAPRDYEQFRSALGRPALDLCTVNDDLRDAIAVLSLLDEYVGLSNTNTHLRAGCSGRTARVLVPSAAEWRWGLEGRHSPWFPEFTLYRETVGWRPTLERLTSDLQERSAALQHPVG